VRLWAGEASAGVRACWGGGPGYTGAGDLVDWEIGELRVSGGGERAARRGPGGVSVAAERGKTVSLSFELPPAGGG